MSNGLTTREREKRKRPAWVVGLLFFIVILTIFFPPIALLTISLFTVILTQT